MHASALLETLEAYIAAYSSGTLQHSFKEAVISSLATERRAEVYEVIADKLWDKYSSVNIDLAILILRRWLSLKPADSRAQWALGSYLLFHGPDWDDEANALIEKSQSNH